ncbi:unnamed protein product [Urochloa humidicola]
MEDTLHAKISRSVVAIRVSDKERVHTDVVLPNNKKVVIHTDEIHCYEEIVTIRCLNPTQGQACGFEDLVGITLCEHIQEHEEVHTYCSQVKYKMLVPGSILLVEDETFDHNCGADQYTECGAPVINEAGHLVGMCTSSYGGYLTALNVRSIAQKIEATKNRVYESVEAAVQHVNEWRVHRTKFTSASPLTIFPSIKGFVRGWGRCVLINMAVGCCVEEGNFNFRYL